MTPLAIAGLCRIYRDKLNEMGAEPVRYADRRPGISLNAAELDHALWMLDQLYVMSKRIAVALGIMPNEPQATEAGLAMATDLRSFELKAQRWLGFVQGVLWSAGLYTIDELRAHVKEAT